MDAYFLKPTDPKVCPRDPITGVRLAPEGESKQKSKYWNRRVLDGSVEVTKPPKAAKPQGDDA